uniref:SWIM-type domain-containing protein n=1 Tax=Parastrongyloides trichosuri TaxID=131310 RepID=A0A0N4Z9K4_PARTI
MDKTVNYDKSFFNPRVVGANGTETTIPNYVKSRHLKTLAEVAALKTTKKFTFDQICDLMGNISDEFKKKFIPPNKSCMMTIPEYIAMLLMENFTFPGLEEVQNYSYLRDTNENPNIFELGYNIYVKKTIRKPIQCGWIYTFEIEDLNSINKHSKINPTQRINNPKEITTVRSTVHIEKEKIVSVSCTCTTATEGFCEHIVAGCVQKILDKDTVIMMVPLWYKLESMDPYQLRTCIMKLFNLVAFDKTYDFFHILYNLTYTGMHNADVFDSTCGNSEISAHQRAQLALSFLKNHIVSIIEHLVDEGPSYEREDRTHLDKVLRREEEADANTENNNDNSNQNGDQNGEVNDGAIQNQQRENYNNNHQNMERNDDNDFESDSQGEYSDNEDYESDSDESNDGDVQLNLGNIRQNALNPPNNVRENNQIFEHNDNEEIVVAMHNNLPEMQNINTHKQLIQYATDELILIPENFEDDLHSELLLHTIYSRMYSLFKTEPGMGRFDEIMKVIIKYVQDVVQKDSCGLYGAVTMMVECLKTSRYMNLVSLYEEILRYNYNDSFYITKLRYERVSKFDEIRNFTDTFRLEEQALLFGYCLCEYVRIIRAFICANNVSMKDLIVIRHILVTINLRLTGVTENDWEIKEEPNAFNFYRINGIISNRIYELMIDITIILYKRYNHISTLHSQCNVKIPNNDGNVENDENVENHPLVQVINQDLRDKKRIFQPIISYQSLKFAYLNKPIRGENDIIQIINIRKKCYSPEMNLYERVKKLPPIESDDIDQNIVFVLDIIKKFVAVKQEIDQKYCCNRYKIYNEDISDRPLCSICNMELDCSHLNERAVLKEKYNELYNYFKYAYDMILVIQKKMALTYPIDHICYFTFCVMKTKRPFLYDDIEESNLYATQRKIFSAIKQLADDDSKEAEIVQFFTNKINEITEFLKEKDEGDNIIIRNHFFFALVFKFCYERIYNVYKEDVRTINIFKKNYMKFLNRVISWNPKIDDASFPFFKEAYYIELSNIVSSNMIMLAKNERSIHEIVEKILTTKYAKIFQRGKPNCKFFEETTCRHIDFNENERCSFQYFRFILKIMTKTFYLPQVFQSGYLVNHNIMDKCSKLKTFILYRVGVLFACYASRLNRLYGFYDDALYNKTILNIISPFKSMSHYASDALLKIDLKKCFKTFNLIHLIYRAQESYDPLTRKNCAYIAIELIDHYFNLSRGVFSFIINHIEDREDRECFLKLCDKISKLEHKCREADSSFRNLVNRSSNLYEDSFIYNQRRKEELPTNIPFYCGRVLIDICMGEKINVKHIYLRHGNQPFNVHDDRFVMFDNRTILDKPLLYWNNREAEQKVEYLSMGNNYPPIDEIISFIKNNSRDKNLIHFSKLLFVFFKPKYSTPYLCESKFKPILGTNNSRLQVAFECTIPLLKMRDILSSSNRKVLKNNCELLNRSFDLFMLYIQKHRYEKFRIESLLKLEINKRDMCKYMVYIADVATIMGSNALEQLCDVIESSIVDINILTEVHVVMLKYEILKSKIFKLNIFYNTSTKNQKFKKLGEDFFIPRIDNNCGGAHIKNFLKEHTEAYDFKSYISEHIMELIEKTYSEYDLPQYLINFTKYIAKILCLRIGYSISLGYNRSNCNLHRENICVIREVFSYQLLIDPATERYKNEKNRFLNTFATLSEISAPSEVDVFTWYKKNV